jgi:hypothetical protein
MTEANLEHATYIVQLIRKGLKREEIIARLAHPNSVGARLLDRAIARRDKGRDFLGRDPDVRG